MNNNFDKTLAIDIETTPIVEFYKDLPDTLQESWETYCDIYQKDEFKKISVSDNIDFYQIMWERLGALNPIYSKIICISFCFYNEDSDEYKFKSLFGDEKDMLDTFFKIIYKFFYNQDVSERYLYLAGHNIKQFDIPFILKRAIINGFSYNDFLPMFKIIEKKPWELNYFKDTKELWNFGSPIFKSSLFEICSVLGLENPKNDIAGSDIYNVYYKQTDLSLDERVNRIRTYCEKDTKAVIQVLKRLN
jgi:DNA polymerase elongation subunit (family B)